MSYMKSTDSAVLAEFGRIMSEKEGLKKIAQVAPLSQEEFGALQRTLTDLTKNPANGPTMEKWINRLKGQTDPFLNAVHTALVNRYQLWSEGKDNAAISSILLPSPANAPQMAGKPAGQPIAAIPQNHASLNSNKKVAEQKAYDVTGKEDMVAKAHPGTAMVEGDVVENNNEQQDADLAVAEKSAKAVLLALYKLAKRLKAENNEKAYALVKETFLDLSKSFKK